jgi:hypothetical protein
MIRGGKDIVTVAEILGHSAETARRYSLPTHHDRERANGIDSIGGIRSGTA